jgi:hypothetical protein
MTVTIKGKLPKATATSKPSNAPCASTLDHARTTAPWRQTGWRAHRKDPS